MAACGLGLVARRRLARGRAAAFYVAVVAAARSARSSSHATTTGRRCSLTGALAALLGGRHRLGWAVLGAGGRGEAVAVRARAACARLVGWRTVARRAALAGALTFALAVVPFAVARAARPLRQRPRSGRPSAADREPGRVAAHHVRASRASRRRTARRTSSGTARSPRRSRPCEARRDRRVVDRVRCAARSTASACSATRRRASARSSRSGRCSRRSSCSGSCRSCRSSAAGAGIAATALLTAALVLTQVWFPARYWGYVARFDLAGVVLAAQPRCSSRCSSCSRGPPGGRRRRSADLDPDRLAARARPSPPHSTSAPSMRTPSVAGSSRTGQPVTNRLIAPSGSLPITESCGPVIPASVIAAVPPESTRASFVCTCVCVPITAVTRPSR